MKKIGTESYKNNKTSLKEDDFCSSNRIGSQLVSFSYPRAVGLVGEVGVGVSPVKLSENSTDYTAVSHSAPALDLE